MPNPVVIDFVVRGMPAIGRALKTTEDAVARSARAQTQLAAREAAQRQRIVQAEARDKVRAMVKVDADVRRIQEKATREVERAAAAKAKAVERAAQQESRAIERAARENVRIQSQATREVERIQERARAKARADADRSLRQAMAISDRRRASEERAAEAAAASRRQFVGTIVGAGAQGFAAGARRVANIAQRTAGMVTQLGGGFNIADSMQRTVSLRGKLADVANRGTVLSDPANATRRTTSDLEGKVRGATMPFGIESEAGAEALDKFASKTGKLNIGLDLLKGLAEMSRAGAGSLDDLADAAGDVFNADTTQNAEQVLSVMRALAGQGKIGAVEMKDLAKQMAGLQAAASKFEGDAGKNMALMGGLAQLARASGGAKSAPQAVTAVVSLTAQLSKEKRLKGMAGLDVQAKTDEGFNRPLDEIMIDVFKGAEKAARKGGHGLRDFDKITMSAFQDQQARRAVDPLANAFKHAGGGASGEKAVRDLLKGYAGATMSKDEVSGHAKDRMREVDAQMAQTREKFDEAVGQRIIPKMLELVPTIERLIPQFVDLAAKGIPAFTQLIESVLRFVEQNKGLVDSLAAHPIGTIIAFEVTKSIATAGIGEAVKRVLEGAIRGGGPTPVPGAPGGSGGVSPAQGGAILGGMLLQGKFFSDKYGEISSGGDAEQEVLAMIQRGDVSGAQERIDAAKKQAGKGGYGNAMAYASSVGRASAYINPMAILGQYGGDYVTKKIVGESEEDKIKKQLSAQAIVDSEAIKKAIADAVAKGAQQGVGGGAPTGTPVAARGQGMVQRN